MTTAAPRCGRRTPSSLRRAACLAGPPRRRAPAASPAERPRGSVRTAAPGGPRAPAPEPDTRPSPPRASPGPARSGRSVWARGSGRPGRPPRPRPVPPPGPGPPPHLPDALGRDGVARVPPEHRQEQEPHGAAAAAARPSTARQGRARGGAGTRAGAAGVRQPARRSPGRARARRFRGRGSGARGAAAGACPGGVGDGARGLSHGTSGRGSSGPQGNQKRLPRGSRSGRRSASMGTVTRGDFGSLRTEIRGGWPQSPATGTRVGHRLPTTHTHTQRDQVGCALLPWGPGVRGPLSMVAGTRGDGRVPPTGTRVSGVHFHGTTTRDFWCLLKMRDGAIVAIFPTVNRAKKQAPLQKC